MLAATRTSNLTASQVKSALDAREILLIDVREPAEFAAERIAGAVNVPLSTFDPATLPTAGDKTIVFQCGSGKRSATAVERCRGARHEGDAHLAGGMVAWKADGLPTLVSERGAGAAGGRS